MGEEFVLPILHRYEIMQDLPSGFLGQTFLVKPRDSELVNVCKICHKNLIGNELKITHFRERITRLAKLDLEFVVKYTDMIETEKAFYLFRPYLNLPTIGDFIAKTEQVSDMVSIKLWELIVRAVSELHEKGISPNILKPNNIFIETENTILITDLYELTTSLTWSFKTPDSFQFAFLAPEFFDGCTAPSFYSDVWTLAALLIYLKTKDLPWSTRNICAMIRQITQTDISTLDYNHLGTSIATVASAVLSKDPLKRPAIEYLLDQKKLRQIVQQNRRSQIPINKKFIPQPSSQRLRSEKKMLSPILLSNQKQYRMPSPVLDTGFYKIRCRFFNGASSVQNSST